MEENQIFYRTRAKSAKDVIDVQLDKEAAEYIPGKRIVFISDWISEKLGLMKECLELVAVLYYLCVKQRTLFISKTSLIADGSS